MAFSPATSTIHNGQRAVKIPDCNVAFWICLEQHQCMEAKDSLYVFCPLDHVFTQFVLQDCLSMPLSPYCTACVCKRQPQLTALLF